MILLRVIPLRAAARGGSMGAMTYVTKALGAHDCNAAKRRSAFRYSKVLTLSCCVFKNYVFE